MHTDKPEKQDMNINKSTPCLKHNQDHRTAGTGTIYLIQCGMRHEEEIGDN